MSYPRRYQFKSDRAYRLACRAERQRNRKRIKDMERKIVGF